MINDLLSFSFKDEPWSYMYSVHSSDLKSYIFATDGQDLFIYGSIWDVFRVKTDKSNGRRLFTARPVLDTGASALPMKERQRTRTGHKGREGHKQGGNDFPKAPSLPKLDRIRPSFEQGAKGAKGAFFEKTFFHLQSLSTVQKCAQPTNQRSTILWYDKFMPCSPKSP